MTISLGDLAKTLKTCPPDFAKLTGLAAKELSKCQKRALDTLDSKDNVFLTGAAGSGKSFLLRRYLRDRDEKVFPTLASTGAAAILVGGRTFHSYFGLGIMEGGVQATIERALNNKRLIKRLKTAEGVVIDEISMISGPTLRAAEAIARKARVSIQPWGGLRVIAVGDFAQLPPVNPHSPQKEWAFLESTWEMSDFKPAILDEIMRTKDRAFLEILNEVRDGRVSPAVTQFLDKQTRRPSEEFAGARLLARRDDVERYNLTKLETIGEKLRSFVTVFSGKEAEIEKFRRNSPIADVIHLKVGALVMLRQNDPEGRWVNGSLGHIREMSEHQLEIKLLSGHSIQVKRLDFSLLDAEGLVVATANNFPVSLAWALTIHKAQGTTLDQVWVDLRKLWEPGQAYVALSRVTTSQGLYVEGWQPRSIVSDPSVREFHQRMIALSMQ